MFGKKLIDNTHSCLGTFKINLQIFLYLEKNLNNSTSGNIWAKMENNLQYLVNILTIIGKHLDNDFTLYLQ